MRLSVLTLLALLPMLAGTCPGPPPPVVDPRCQHVRAYCESERVIVHCDGPHFAYKVDCSEDPNLPDGSLCVEPEVDVALCTPHEEPELLCPEVGRVHGYECADEDTIALCSYGLRDRIRGSSRRLQVHRQLQRRRRLQRLKPSWGACACVPTLVGKSGWANLLQSFP